VGSFDGNRAELRAELTSGGIFNGSDPLASQNLNYGTMVLTFTGCNAGSVEYSFPGPGLSGTMEITRVIDSNVGICESLASQ
jgi:hypothetical protein